MKPCIVRINPEILGKALTAVKKGIHGHVNFYNKFSK